MVTTGFSSGSSLTLASGSSSVHSSLTSVSSRKGEGYGRRGGGDLGGGGEGGCGAKDVHGM